MTDSGEAPDFFTIEAGVNEFTQLAELSEALASRLGGWATDGADPASSAIMGSLSVCLTEHSDWWRAQIPESVLLQDARSAAAGSPRLSEVLARMEVRPPDRRAAVVPILDKLVVHLEALAGRMSPVGDGPALRVVRLVLADLEDRPS